MTKPQFAITRTTKDGKPAVELVVRNTTKTEHADFRALLDSLGYGAASGMDNAKRIVCTTPEQIDAARNPIKPYFDAKGFWI